MPATDSVTEADFDWFSPEVCQDPQKYDAMIRRRVPSFTRRGTTSGRRDGTRRSS